MPTDVTGYETVTITIPASAYNASAGAPQMARVKYNKLFPLVITSDDMGKTELTNNWAAVNGYPVINDWIDLGIQPGGTKFLQAPYKKYYMQGRSSSVNDYQPMTYTDNVGKTQRYRITSAVMPFELKSDGTANYDKIDANDAKLMLRTGWSFAQHDVDDISSVDNISTAMTANNTIWATKVGIGLKVMVEPNGNHNYLAAGRANSGICWNIFQNSTSEYPFQSKALNVWAATRSDWTSTGFGTMPTTFSSKPTGGYARTFFQGNESSWMNTVNSADGSNIVIGGTHGLGDEIKNHLRTATNVTNNAWVGSADEVWEYYHIYNNLKIENVNYENGNLTFDVKVPTYLKNQYRELTLNIPGLTGGGTPTFSKASGKTVPVTGGSQQTSTNGIGYTMNIGLESSINDHIDQMMAIYRDDQTNLFVKRDLEYLISQLWDGSTYTTQLNATAKHDLTILSSLGTTLATIKTDTDGDKSFAVPRYVVSGDKLYEVAANSSLPNYAQTITTTETPSAISYSEKSLSSLAVNANNFTPTAVLVVEGEDMTGMTVLGADLDLAQTSHGRYWAMALGSGGMAGNLVSGNTATVTSALPRGKYKAVIGYGETYKSQGTYNYNLLVDGTQVATVSSSSATNNAVTELTTAEFEVSADGQTITLTTNNTNTGSRWIDYIYFVQTGSLDPTAPTATLTSNITSSMMVNKTATLTATTGLNGGTLTSTSIYAADASGNKTGDALATSTTETTVTYSFTPASAGTYYFVSESVNSVGTTTSSLLTVTVVASIDNYTLIIIDKSGSPAITTTVASGDMSNDPLPTAYRSPFANNYKYYNTAAEAQANSGNNITSVSDFTQETIYVGYDVDATKMAADKVHAIWANNIWMHVVVNEGNASKRQVTSHDGFITDYQKYDVVNKKGTTVQNSNLTVPNLPIVDNTYMWVLGTDPYNIKLKNKALGFYNSPTSSSSNAMLYDVSEESSAETYYLTYWQNRAGTVDVSAAYYRLVKRTDGLTVGSNGDHDGSWRAYSTSNLNDNDWNAVTKLYVQELPKVNIIILDEQNEVECIFQGYYNTTATTMPQSPTGSYTPYTLSRAFTSLHKWYYSYTSESVNDPVVYGSAMDFSKLSSNANLYVKYTLDTDKWGSVVKTADTNALKPFTSTGSSYDWYSMKVQNMTQYLLADDSSEYPVTVNETNTAPTETTTLGQWAFTGTPYNVKIINRKYGGNVFLGITESSSNHDYPKLYPSGTEDVNFSFEAVNNIGDNNSRLLLRPMGVFNGDYPYLYLGSSYSPTHAAYEDNAGANSRLVLNWLATTDIIRPSKVHLEVSNATPYVDNTVTLTATVTPDDKDRNVISSLSIEQQVNGVWIEVGTAYTGSNVEGATKDDETGIVTVTYSFTPAAEGTFNFRAYAVVDGEDQYSTAEASAGGDGDVVEVIATVKPLTPYNSTYTLTLIDKDGNELLTENNVPASRITATNSISGRNGDPLNDDWRSPLVTTYKYYEGTSAGKTSAQAADDDNIVDWNTYTGTTIYVGYTVSDAIDLNGKDSNGNYKFSSLNDDTNSLMQNRVHRDNNENNPWVRNASKFGKMYMLKFKTSAAYNLEDGSDNRNATATPANTLIYPYTNGDGPIYMYSHQRYLDQKDNGASTRTRWPWYLVSPKNDPYHVYITSWQNSHTDNTDNTNHYSYLRTYYNSTLGVVVTNNVTDDDRTLEGGNGSQIMPTDYMILSGSGTDGLNYKLMTSSPITDASTTERRTVTSFEQYWRNNPTAQVASGGTKNSTVVATDNSTLTGYGWHNYKTWVNAANWAGTKYTINGKEYSKDYLYDDHWYMTVNVGDGSLDIVETNIDGVLVLLDNHGWEIMRHPIVEHDDDDHATVQEALRKYDSPMVKNYKFYSTRNVDHKVPGYHKYDITYLTSDKTKITGLTLVNSSEIITSLADYPEVNSGGALTDLYVTYDVADDYASSYTGAATEGATSASNFLLKQGDSYAKANGTSITSTADAADADRWKLKPNFNIDAEMGYLYENGSDDEKTKTDLETLYYGNGQNGFDPYNLWLQNATTSTYFTTNATTATLDGGAWSGNGSTLSLAAVSSHITPTGYDQKTLSVTNATFMAVKDQYGNMRLMPRFDHEQVVDNFSTLADPATLTAYDATSTQTTQLTTPVTYHIIDNSGNEALQMTVTDGIGISLPNALRSPMVSAYHYHSTQAHAADAATRLTGDLTVAQEDVYVSYTVDATKMAATKKYAIHSGTSNVFLHLVFRGQQANSSYSNFIYRYRLDQQKYDQETSNSPSPAANQFNYSNLPFVDNTYLWTLGDDPYNIIITSAAEDNWKYLARNSSSSPAGLITNQKESANASKYCLLYWNGDPESSYSALRYRGLATETYMQYDGNNDGRWVDASANSTDNAKLVIEELPEVNVNVVNAAGAVEYTLKGRYVSTATVPASTTVPFFLQRTYTSGQTYYYDAACSDQMTAGSAPEATKMTAGMTDGKYNIYVRYDLDSKWNTEDLFLVSTEGSKEYYILKYEANNTTPYLGVNSSKTVIGLAASSSDEAQWALYGTPYALRIESRANSGYYVGIPENAVYNTKPQVYNSFTNIISTWELAAYVNALNSDYKSLPLIRPQGAISREAPLLYLRPNSTSAALTDHDDNNVRVTFEAGAKVTLVIIDKGGREVLSEQASTAVISSTSGDPLSAGLRSPYAKNYRYYATAEEAQSNTGTTLDETALMAKVNETVYVGYDINTLSGETILKTNGTAAYRLRRNTNNQQGMHAVFSTGDTGSQPNNYGWKMTNQTKDYAGGSTVSYNTLPFIDRAWAWEFVSSNNDPYSVKIRNRATGQYLMCENNAGRLYQASFAANESEAAVYSLLQFDSGTAYLAIYVDDSNSSQKGYLHYADADNGTWRLRDSRTVAGSEDNTARAYIRVEELTEPLDIHIVGPAGTAYAGEVEATIHGYRNSGVGANTVPTFVPYFLTRAYTSDQKFYYTKEAAAAASDTEISTVDDASITDSYGSDEVKDVFVSYRLDDANWISSGTALSTEAKTAGTTIIKPFYSGEGKINWYGIRTNENNSNYLKATTTELPAVVGRTTIDNSSPDNADMKRSEWAVIGTPYSIQLVERQHGMASHLGVAADAAHNGRAYVYQGGTADVVTTFELVTGLGGTTGKLFLRPQGSLNGQTPYVYIGGNDNNMPLSRGAAAVQIIDLTWITETDAKTVTFTIYDRDGNSMSSTVSDYTFYGVSQGDDLDDLFEAAGMKRRYCEYTFYSDAEMTTAVTTVGTDADETIRAKWDYTDDAPVFNEGVANSRDYQYYMMGVGSGSYTLMDVEESSGTYTFKPMDGVVTPRDQAHQFAIVGNPYKFYLYNRGADKNIRRKASLDLTFEDTEDNGTTPTEELEFDMPIVSTLTYSSTECSFRSKKSGRFLTVSNNAFTMTATASPTQKTRFRYIIVPVRVFKEGATTWTNDAVNDQKDYRMYGLEMNPNVSGTVTARSTSERITTDYLRASGNAVGTARDYRHAFCDYTYYRSYDWTDELSEPIPEEGLSYYGGKEQNKKQFFATYTVDEQAFSRLYYMNANNNSASSGNTTWDDAYIGKGSSSTNGYTLTGNREFENEVKKDENDTYRWFFTGDPYDMQIHCVGVGELNSAYVLALKKLRSTGEPTEVDGTAAVLTADLKEGNSDSESYGQFSHFEIIQRSSGQYVLWSIDTDNRYDYCLTNHFKDYNGAIHLAQAESNINMNTREWMLVDVFNHYTITWHVMENQGTTGEPSYADVASKDVVYDENTVLQVEDLPDELRRHFCEYSEMYSDNGCTAAIANNALTVTASTSIYVPYTLDSGAPDFLFEAPTSSTAEKYWYEIHYPGLDKYIYYKTTDGTLYHDSQPIETIRNLGDGYTPYRWALIGTPYSVKFYNKQTSSYLTTDGSTLSMSASGTTFNLMNDETGEWCAILDAATNMYVNATANVQRTKSYYSTSAEFTNTYGVVKIAFVLHYSAKTLRQRDSNDDHVLDTPAANTTETIKIDSYQKMDKALDDVLPTVWKRAFCKYTYDWGASSTESTSSGTTVTKVTRDMVYAYNNDKENYLFVHVTYDYETDSPFKWSTADATWENKHWYYLVNNHIQGTERGKMVYRDSGPKLRVSQGLVDSRQYLYNFEWCVIGDPYGFKMLNHYDPDELFSQYISVTSGYDSAGEGKQIEQQSGNTQCLFEMMPGRYSYNFWMHPIYAYNLMGNEYDNNSYSYVGHNYNGSAAIIPNNKYNSTYLHNNAAANLRLEIRTNATLKEYLDYAGFVGSIKTSVVPEGLAKKITNGTATDEELKDLHNLIDDPSNLIQMKQGYYRIIPYVYEKGKIDGEQAHRRYVRGYHYGSGTEGYDNTGTASNSNHYYDRQEIDNSNANWDKSLMANELPALAEFDPASIFHFEATTEDGHPRYLVTTQGLNLSGHSLSTADAFKTRYEDIGAVTCQLKTVTGDPTNAANHLYLSWQQNSTNNEPNDYRRMALRNCFEMYGFTRLYLQPVGEESDNLMPLKLEMYPGKHTPKGSDTPQNYYFASIYVPYDLVLPSGDVYAYAGVKTKNDGQGSENDWRLQCEKLSAQTIGGVTYEKGKFIPAGTPALIRATTTEGTLANTDGHVNDYDYDHASDASGFITLTIPNNAPATGVTKVATFFKGQYLEQELTSSAEGGVPATDESVYIFGQATGNDYATIPDDDNRTQEGDSHPKLEAGFYINKNTPDGTADYSKRNNLYVRHNKIYLFEKTEEKYYPNSTHYSGGGGSVRQFIALNFGETGIEEQSQVGQTVPRTGVYDLQGRRVASAEEAADGSWRRKVTAGVYVVNGKKIVIH